MLDPGTVIADRYRIVEAIGEGGMGAVYRAENVHIRKPVALKVLHDGLSTNEEVAARFEHEAVAGAHIKDPHVAAALDFGKLADGSFFLVMEYVEGKSLRDALREAGALPAARALAIFRGIVRGVAAAHAKGVVHRDLKPENVILVERDGDRDFPKVLDFGISKVDGTLGDAGETPSAPARVLTRAGAILGTPEYMSPEQALGQPVDARADLYSLGVMLYEMLVGALPYGGGAVTVLKSHVLKPPPELPREVLEGVDPRLAEVLARLLAKSPDARYASASELLAALGMLDARHDSTLQKIAVTSSASSSPSIVTGLVQVRTGADRRMLLQAPTLAVSTLSPLLAPRRLRPRVAAAGAALAVVAILAMAVTLPRSGEPVKAGASPAVRASAASPKKHLVVDEKERAPAPRRAFYLPWW